jgi:predicted O-methyltransferase YrrM
MGSSTRTRLQALAPSLDQNTLNALSDLYDGKALLGTESENPIVLDKITRISPEQGAMLRQLMMDNSVSRSLEVGFAYGFSTLWMLDALRKYPEAVHVAVDPFEKSQWNGIGLNQVHKIRFEGKFKWLQDFSIHALSDLIRQGEKFDFIYIDGNHRFDNVIVDFYLCDQMARPGTLIVLDDVWMQSIRSASNFIIENRSYEVELQPIRNMIALRKIRDDDRDWQHFKSFLTTDSLQTRFNRLVERWIPEKLIASSDCSSLSG